MIQQQTDITQLALITLVDREKDMPSSDEFRDELRSQLRAGELKKLPHVDINAGELHRHLGGYPGPNHQMPSCCQVMERERRALDKVVAGPPSGKGASLTIRYRLPR